MSHNPCTDVIKHIYPSKLQGYVRTHELSLLLTLYQGHFGTCSPTLLIRVDTCLLSIYMLHEALSIITKR